MLGWVAKDSTLEYLCPLCAKDETHYCALRDREVIKYDINGEKPCVYNPFDEDISMLKNLHFIDRFKLMWVAIIMAFFCIPFVDNLCRYFRGEHYKYKLVFRIFRNHSVVRRIIFKSVAHRAQNCINIPRILTTFALGSK